MNLKEAKYALLNAACVYPRKTDPDALGAAAIHYTDCLRAELGERDELLDIAYDPEWGCVTATRVLQNANEIANLLNDARD